MLKEGARSLGRGSIAELMDIAERVNRVKRKAGWGTLSGVADELLEDAVR